MRKLEKTLTFVVWYMRYKKNFVGTPFFICKATWEIQGKTTRRSLTNFSDRDCAARDSNSDKNVRVSRFQFRFQGRLATSENDNARIARHRQMNRSFGVGSKVKFSPLACT